MTPSMDALRQRLRAGLVVTLLATGVPNTAAATAPGVFSDFTVRSWTRKDGLSASRVWAITQDRDGYLWIGTASGLVRFDGVRFVAWSSISSTPLPEESVIGLMSTSDGSLWASFPSAGLARIRGSHVTRYGEASGIAHGYMKSLVEDRAGRIWAGGRGGLFRLQDDRWEHQGISTGLPEGPNYGLYVDKAGVLWVLTPGGVYYTSSTETHFHQSASPPLIAVSERILERAQLAGRETRVSAPSETEPGTVTLTGNALNPLTSIEDRQGYLWLPTLGQGLWRLPPGSSTPGAVEKLTKANGLSSDTIRAVHEDREGNIWVGTQEGLDRLSPRRVTTIRNIGFPVSVQSTKDGSIWVGSDRGLTQFTGNALRHYSAQDGLPSSMVRTLFTDRSGTLWVATDRGVAQLANGRFSRLDFPAGGLFYRISAIATNSRNDVWIGDMYQGVFRWRDRGLTSFEGVPEMKARTAHTLFSDSHDRVWVGLSGGRLGMFPPSGQPSFHDTGLAGSITSIVEDRRGVIWLGGGNGIARLTDGHVLTATADRNGFPGTSVTAIVADAHDSVWIGADTGIVRIDQGEFDRLASAPRSQIRYRLYDETDGLDGMPIRVASQAGARSSDGRLWFLTDGGLAIIDPRRFSPSRVLPKVLIEGVRADTLRLDPASRVTLPARSARVEIDYTALLFSSPGAVRFKYRLDGFDKTWVDAGAKRQATYTNLAPGTYQFRVVATDKEGLSDSIGASVEMTMSPTFAQTPWFIAVCIAGAGLAGGAAWTFRATQLRRRFGAVLAERARIGREIHDTLLQSLVAVALESGSIAERADTPPESREKLIRLRKQVEDEIREVRTSIWNLRSATLDRQPLAEALRAAGERVAKRAALRFSMVVSGQPRPCPHSVEEQLLRIGQEAVANAARHAQATEITIELHYADASVLLRVSDNGVGFSPDALRVRSTSHFGLTSMRERAEQLRGEFTLITGPGEGTRVVTVLPAPAAKA